MESIQHLYERFYCLIYNTKKHDDRLFSLFHYLQIKRTTI